LVLAQVMRTEDANFVGIFNGVAIMKLINTEAGVAALRHSRANVVTAAIDRIDFHHFVFIGDFLTLKASLNFVGKTSMEVCVRFEAENPLTGKKAHYFRVFNICCP
jgi:acyl-CoA hydrolase